MAETLSPETHQHLHQLQRQYFALYPIRLVDFEPLGTTGRCLVPLYKHQDWIVRHLLSTVYQPARDYRRKWLKRLIDIVERGLRSEEASHEEWVSGLTDTHGNRPRLMLTISNLHMSLTTDAGPR
jgi:hypothetical protein